ncbi:MAG TPA: class II aldolase/adducin family protein [Ktedonobacteraceae bacterium]|nr:class II aldolase/adducin family protein [Ktedonobacteraceae bacterium]
MALFSGESMELRSELAYACRILAANGQNDAIYGHVTHRLPGAENFWMKPAGMGLDEITPEMLIRMDLDGQVLEGKFPRHLEYPIHTEIFRARPEIRCVIHTHPPYSIAFAATEQPLRAISHEGCMFTPPDVPRFTMTSNLIVTRQLGEAVAATLGNALACYLVNHGIVVAAETIELAVIAALNLERASQLQLLALASSQHLRYTGDEECLAKRKMYHPEAIQNTWNYYCRRIGPL